jgi:site-specific recombinase XerD
MYQHGGVDTLVLKDILGHKSIATTEIYTHLSDENIKKAMESNPLSEEIEKKKK